MNDKHRQFIHEAIRMAYQGMEQGAGGPFGCVIVKGGEIIAMGFNSVIALNDPTAHAEIVAIRQACQRLNSFQLTGCSVYCTCEPCPMCLGAIYWARPDSVFYASTRKDAAHYGFDDDMIYNELILPPTKRKFLLHQIPLPEADQLLDVWNKKADKLMY
jgi:tRNA(Arg) A34 adenosine deaminase TadA